MWLPVVKSPGLLIVKRIIPLQDPSNDSSPTTFTSSSLNHLIDEPLLAGCSSSSAVSHFDDEDKNGSMVSVSGPTSYQELSTK